MKNIKYLVIAFATFLSVVSCNDALEIVQDGELSESAVFTNPTNMESYLNGAIYGSLDNTAQIKFTSVFTDELRIGPSSVGGDLDLYRYIITPNSGYANAIWSGRYTTIKRVNTLVKGASTITPTPDNTAQYNTVLGEARAIRALAYLDLLTYFSPDTKNDGALGVILTTEPAKVGDILPRVTNGEIWEVVEEDLNFAYNNIDPNYQLESEHLNSYFISKAAVNAIRARMYLYRGNYPLAMQYAQSAITDSGLSLTPALPIPPGTVGSTAWNTAFYNVAGGTSPYRRMWVDAISVPNSDENIFKLSRPSTGSGGIAGLWTTNTTNLAGAPQWTLGLNLFNAIASLPKDIRRYAFIDSTSENDFWIIDKYPGKGNTPLKNDIKMFRISEMYLILAECAAQNNLPLAADYIRQVRQARAYEGTVALPIYPTKVDALRDILKERRIELALEGHRFIDLKRLGQEAGVSIDRNINDDWISPSTPLTLSVTDYRFTLPIPASEISGNPSIKQNEGY